MSKELLFPALEPFYSETMPVGDIHKVYYEVCGNKDGEPCLFLHGGPGSGCSTWARGWFDPERYKIVLIDQRGAGRSTPTAETRENTTQDLINDIELIRQKLGITSWKLVFGGSWGSFLTLAYANHVFSEDYSGNLKTIENLVIYGTFLGRKSELESTYGSGGPAAHLYYDAYQDFMDPIHKLKEKQKISPDQCSVLDAYHEIFKNREGLFSDEEVEYAVMRWSQWESRIASAVRTPEHWKDIDDYWASNPSGLLSHSILENHYFMNGCWLDGDIFLQDKFAQRLATNDVNIAILIGRFDVVCPPSTAFQLHNNLQRNKVQCKVEITLGGHTALDECNTTRILEMINNNI
mgnify:CR=1 FL=1